MPFNKLLDDLSRADHCSGSAPTSSSTASSGPSPAPARSPRAASALQQGVWIVLRPVDQSDSKLRAGRAASALLNFRTITEPQSFAARSCAEQISAGNMPVFALNAASALRSAAGHSHRNRNASVTRTLLRRNQEKVDAAQRVDLPEPGPSTPRRPGCDGTCPASADQALASAISIFGARSIPCAHCRRRSPSGAKCQRERDEK